MKDAQAQAPERTFVLVDPEGSARALRAWGGRRAQIEVSDGVVGKVLLAPFQASPTELRGTRLIVASHTVQSCPDSSTPITVQVTDGALILNGTIAVALVAEGATHIPACREAIVLDNVPRGLPPDLQVVAVREWTQAADVGALTELRHLSILDLQDCRSLTSLEPLASLQHLTGLDLRGCEQVQDLRPLAGLTELNQLNLAGCSALRDLGPLSTLRSLTALDLSSCHDIEDLGPLAALENLLEFELQSCPRVRDLRPLSCLKRLSRLSLGRLHDEADFGFLDALRAFSSLRLVRCKRLTRVAGLRACRSLAELSLIGCGNIRDLDTLAVMPSLRRVHWVEDAAPHAVLAATAFLRKDAETVQAAADDWLESVELSKAPDTFGLRLVNAFALGGGADWAASALTRLATALRARAHDDENPLVIAPTTWAAWTNAALALDDESLRAALDGALRDLRPGREIAPVLTLVLTALADLGPATQAPRRAAPEWLLPRIREVLAPVAANADHARLAAPAAAVFFAGFGLDAAVRAWLDRGTHPDAPHWRDRVVHALLARDARAGNLAAARAWFGALVTPDAQDRARATLAEAFAARLPAEAAAELDAIGDDALRSRVARALGQEPALLATPGGLYALVLALQDDADALGETLTALVEAHPHSPLVAALAADLAPAAPPAPDPVPLVVAHPAWKDEVAGRKWDAFAGALPAAPVLVAEAVAARACEAGLLDEVVRREVVGRVVAGG